MTTNWRGVQELCNIEAWALDFTRALRSRPLLARVLFRLIVGKYAYREFIGLMDSLAKIGDVPYFDYELTNSEYHADPVPAKWWVERDPMPIKRAD